MSGMTVCEKILARASGRDSIKPGDIIDARPDIAMSHDNTYLVHRSFEEIGASEVATPNSIVVVLDHRAPANTVNSANSQKAIRDIVRQLGVSHFFDIGTGICHQILIEEGIVKSGMLVIGSDSHSTTYGAVGALGIGIGAMDLASVWVKGSLWLRVPETMRIAIEDAPPTGVFTKDIALQVVKKIGIMGADYCCIEFHGSYMSRMRVSERMTLCNMAAETGAKGALVSSDYFSDNHFDHPDSNVQKDSIPDEASRYSKMIDLNIETIEPSIALPHSVENVVPVSSVEGIEIDQAFLGSCTNGRLDDLTVAASLLSGRKVNHHTRMIIAPASREIYLAAAEKGVIETLVRSGAIIIAPSCGPCLGAHQGVLADGEICISSSNRNFKGRMGSSESEIYLASPATVAASAIEGKITDPRRYLE